MTSAPTTEQAWELYVSSWKATTAEEKRELFSQSLAPDCAYIDPLVDLRGWDALSDYMAQLDQQIPGAHFVTTWFNHHHGRSVARWDMVAGDGTRVGEGISHGRYGDDGKLTSMTGFYEVPSDVDDRPVER